MFTNFNWSECFQAGAIKDEYIFLKKWNILPSKFVYSISKKELDLENVNYKGLEQEFPQCIYTTSSAKSEETNSSVEDQELEAEELLEGEDELVGIYISGEWIHSVMHLYTEKAIFYIEPTNILLYYSDSDPVELVSRLLKYIPFKQEEHKEASVKLVAFQQEYYVVNSKIKPTKIDIEENYNDDFLPIYDDIIKFINERQSGLIVLNGIPGTGKTNLLRHIVSNYDGDYIIVPTSLTDHLGSPEFISFMLSNRDSIFILEDCEQALMDREDSISNAIASILNMADGLMSDIFNIKLICTFNADIESIDPAILRKGRCFVNYEFKELSVEKTKNLLNKQGIELDSYEPMTLADIYNFEDTDCSNKQINKLGFDV